MQAGYIVVGVSGGLVLVAGCTHSRWAWWPMARESRTATAAAAVAETPQAPMTVNHAPPPENAPRSVAMPVSYPQPANGPPVSAVPDSPVPDGFSEFEPAKIMARVGEEVILAGDLMGPINQALAPYHGVKSPEEIAATREALLRRQVQTAVENKLMYVAALRNIPIDKRKDALPQIWERLHTKFDEEELPKALERAKVETAADLDAILRQYGWSLAKQRRQYAEKQIGLSGAAEHVNKLPEITHQDLLDYYLEHVEEFEQPAMARWEQLSVRFDRTASREEAYAQIVRMGNEVVLGGAPLWAVAKRDSHDANAPEGGQHDWTTQGSLVSKPLDAAIFSLPIGEMSQIIEDDRGFHIVRVLERREATRTPFTEAQAEIRKKIQAEMRQNAFAEYVARLRQEIPVWTIYDSEEAEEPSNLY